MNLEPESPKSIRLSAFDRVVFLGMILSCPESINLIPTLPEPINNPLDSAPILPTVVPSLLNLIISPSLVFLLKYAVACPAVPVRLNTPALLLPRAIPVFVLPTPAAESVVPHQQVA